MGRHCESHVEATGMCSESFWFGIMLCMVGVEYWSAWIVMLRILCHSLICCRYADSSVSRGRHSLAGTAVALESTFCKRILGAMVICHVGCVKVRFSNPVLPGQTLQTDMWKEKQRVFLECKVSDFNVVFSCNFHPNRSNFAVDLIYVSDDYLNNFFA